jgi:hypothetical protein
MIKDTIATTKQLQEPEQIVESLLRLRDEIYARGPNVSNFDVFYKINSCLYSGYQNAA